MSVALGIDGLLGRGHLEGQRVGLVCNPASVDGEFRHTVDRIWAAPGVTLGGIFGPQHGFRSDVQDNMVETPHGRHARYGVPIYSLYGDTREPSAQMLDDIDLLVIDLQDVGTRVYTYVATMANCLRAAQTHDVPVVVCDRPNPIGGAVVEGPVLQSGYESFVGQFPIPLRHGMTIGELARLFNEQFGIGAELTVSGLEGMGPGDVSGRGRGVVGHAVAQSTDARQRRGLSGCRAGRGHEPVGRTRHHPAVRVNRGTVD